MESAGQEIMSKVLIIGATGYLGRYFTEASLKLAHPTFALVRKATAVSNPEKAKLIETFKEAGVTILYGDLNDHESLVKAVKLVDIVFSMTGHESQEELAQQMNVVSAIKEAGNIKRYFPSEYGVDIDRVQLLEPAKSRLSIKSRIRQAIREAGIPYTFVSNNFFATYFLTRLGQVEATGPPEEKVFILGDGNTTVIFVDEQDVATYSMKAADDPRTLNKILYVRPPMNIYSQNELVTLWEEKTGKVLERIHVHEEEILEKIRDLPAPWPFFYAIAYASFVKGEQTNFEIDLKIGIEATELYPNVKYTTVDEWLSKLISMDTKNYINSS